MGESDEKISIYGIVQTENLQSGKERKKSALCAVSVLWPDLERQPLSGDPGKGLCLPGLHWKGVGTLRENLKKARKAKGLTQQQMAERLNITLRSYQRIESGESVGRIEHWDTMEDIFQIHQRKLREC